METWKPVLGYEGLYEASDHGHVQGLPRKDNPENNELSNLRWGTRLENIHDCFRNGGRKRKSAA
jgi:hypothetical protein